MHVGSAMGTIQLVLVATECPTQGLLSTLAMSAAATTQPVALRLKRHTLDPPRLGPLRGWLVTRLVCLAIQDTPVVQQARPL